MFYKHPVTAPTSVHSPPPLFTAEMEQGGVLDDEDMDLEEQGPTKVVKEMVSQQRGGWGGGDGKGLHCGWGIQSKDPLSVEMDLEEQGPTKVVKEMVRQQDVCVLGRRMSQARDEKQSSVPSQTSSACLLTTQNFTKQSPPTTQKKRQFPLCMTLHPQVH